MFTTRIIPKCAAVQFPKLFSRIASAGKVGTVSPFGYGKRPIFRKNKIIDKYKIAFDARLEAEHQKHLKQSDKVMTQFDDVKKRNQEGEKLPIEVVSVPERNPQSELEDTFTPYRFVYPEFLPDPTPQFRNKLREKLERIDMLKRRSNIDIPEFYVGSVLSVTVSDPNSPGKAITFVGICIIRENYGLNAYFTLRNAVDGEGVEIMYDMYNPSIQNITVLKLEKRLDENLRYLRDAPIEYSTFPFDMTPELRSADAPVPINPLKVKLNPKPWSGKWHLWGLKGIDMDDIKSQLEQWQLKKWATFEHNTNVHHVKYDMMKTYRETTPVEEQVEIFKEIHPQLASMTQTLRKLKRKRTFVKPQKMA